MKGSEGERESEVERVCVRERKTDIANSERERLIQRLSL